MIVVITNSVYKEEDLTHLLKVVEFVSTHQNYNTNIGQKGTGTSRMTSYPCAGVTKHQRGAHSFLPSPNSHSVL